ncbi:hypothetical protein PGQ11_000947 [Apiospora arundinis]
MTVIVDRTRMTAIYVGAGSKVRRLLGKSQYITLSVHEVDSVKQGFEPPPLCAEQPGWESYVHIYNNAPHLKDDFMLPNPKDVFESGPVGNTTDNMGGIEETCFAALVDLAFNQLNAKFDNVLAVHNADAAGRLEHGPGDDDGETAQGKEEADKISEDEAEGERKAIVELSILPFVGRSAMEIWPSEAFASMTTLGEASSNIAGSVYQIYDNPSSASPLRHRWAAGCARLPHGQGLQGHGPEAARPASGYGGPGKRFQRAE